MQDYQDGWLTVHKAIKGPNSNAPTRGTKNRGVRRLPVAQDLQAWIEWRLSHVTSEDRLRGPIALFPNPSARNGERRWIANTLREKWNRAAEGLVVRVKMYEGTEHAFASDALARGVDLHRLRDFLGHSDAHSAERYAKLAEVGRLDVPRRPPDLSLGRRGPENDEEKPFESGYLWRDGRDSNPQLPA